MLCWHAESQKAFWTDFPKLFPGYIFRRNVPGSWSHAYYGYRELPASTDSFSQILNPGAGCATRQQSRSEIKTIILNLPRNTSFFCHCSTGRNFTQAWKQFRGFNADTIDVIRWVRALQKYFLNNTLAELLKSNLLRNFCSHFTSICLSGLSFSPEHEFCAPKFLLM